jgi:hypothetical protein
MSRRWAAYYTKEENGVEKLANKAGMFLDRVNVRLGVDRTSPHDV